jgi:hypothetical protein
MINKMMMRNDDDIDEDGDVMSRKKFTEAEYRW